jgi:tetratricopeptide (TPR) repeat protein
MSIHLPESLVATTLSDWNSAAEEALALEEYGLAAQMAQVILRRLPRHLSTYQRLLRIAWQLKRWDEGEDWGRRLLQADPSNGLAWRSLARAAEHRGQRAQAHAIYQRAFEVIPYDPEVRAGLSRTSLDASRSLEMNLACLGAIYLRGRRWAHAATTYRTLARAESRRIDFQALLMLALWQNRAVDDAYALARHLTQAHPHLLLAWAVLNVLGDENDRALARNPLETMDPDGDFVQRAFGVQVSPRAVKLSVTPAEVELLEEFLQAAGFAEEPDEEAGEEIEAQTLQENTAEVAGTEANTEEVSDDTHST